MGDPYITAYRMLLPRRYRNYLERAGGDEDMCRETLLYGTFYEEYQLYGFAGKSNAERREYLTDAVRNRLCRRINGRKGQRIVMDKWLTYRLFSDFYKRQAWLLSSTADIDRLVDEGLKRECLVAKPVDDCGGRGVQLLRGDNKKVWQDSLMALLDKRSRWIVEERIVQDAAMARWNTDSVNTVRMNTILRNGKVTHYTPFILTGRSGSFVNNGAQGGFFASIDAGSGTIITDGFDETGKKYGKHPDSGIPFRDERIPQWSDLLSVTAAMAARVPDVTYVGWDMALAPCGWVCVEANKGEFVAQQVTLGRGLRNEFEKMVGRSSAYK